MFPLEAFVLLHQQKLNHGIPFQKGNFLDLEFGDNPIGVVVAFYAIVHFPEEQVEKVF